MIKRFWKTERSFNRFWAWAGALVGLTSLILGVCAHNAASPADWKPLGRGVVAGWLLIPPVIFWTDWVVYSTSDDSPQQQDRTKHSHDLSRNIWLALVVVLVALFGIEFKT